MRNRFLFLLVTLVPAICVAQVPMKFRSGIFLHHSTGDNIWGPNGSPTSVPVEMSHYNLKNGLVGTDSVTLNELWWPADGNNEWERWHRIFDNRDTIEADIRGILNSNRIVMLKSCFPSSEIWGNGSAADSSNPTTKSISNYKWHWRNFVRVMADHPFNFFVIWTNAPLEPHSTTDAEAKNSDRFCRWAKDTLARGQDPGFGAFPPNVYVFDFFHTLAGPDGKLPSSYAAGSGDSHPNSAATALVAPQLVAEAFEAARAYELVLEPVVYDTLYATVGSTGEGVLLTWATVSEVNNEGFLVERREGTAGPFQEIPSAAIPGHGSTYAHNSYSFRDTTLSVPGDYYYRLNQVGSELAESYSDTVHVLWAPNQVGKDVPVSFSLEQNYPNPFNPGTEIRFSVDRAGPVSVEVYDLTGRLVRILFSGPADAGRTYSVRLDGSELSSGVYFYTLRSETATATRKLVLLK